MTLLLVVLRRVNGDEIRKTELAQAYLQPSTLEALVKTMFALPVHSEYDEEAAKYFLLTEEILLALAAIGYFERTSAVEGLSFIERFINEVLSCFLKSQTASDEEGGSLLQNVKVISYVLGTLRLFLLMQPAGSQTSERLGIALQSFIGQVIKQIQET